MVLAVSTAAPLASAILFAAIRLLNPRHLHGVCPKPLPVRQSSRSYGLVAARCNGKLRSEAPDASCAPGELETSVAAATAWRRLSSSGGPSELFAPATAAQHKLRRGWKRPAPAERSRRAERSRKACRSRPPTRRKAVVLERPAVAVCGNATGGLWRGHEEETERDETPRERE